MSSRLNRIALILLIVGCSAASAWSQSITVSLPNFTMDTSIPIGTTYTQPVTTTQITPSVDGNGNCTDNSTCYIGFQADFTFDSAVAVPSPSFPQAAGLTASGWTISGHPLPGSGTIKTMRFSAFVNDGSTPLSGAGVLFNISWVRVATSSASTDLTWKPSPNNFLFIDTDLNSIAPNQTNGSITINPPCNLSEGFDVLSWLTQNNSQPGPGTTGWFQGSTAAFPSQSGVGNSYAAANYQNGLGTATLSNWLFTPPLALKNTGQLVFWTRTVNTPVHADRLQVRMSTNGASTNVGATATSVGDFTTLLLDINPTYTLAGYPNVWTQFAVPLSALGSPATGRLAFRYFVENGGPSGTNSDYIGIDSVTYDCNAVPVPTPTPAPTSTPAPTPTPIPISISGAFSYCTNPVPGPVPNVTVTATGSASTSTLSNASGNYQLLLPPGGTYTVTPTKPALLPGAIGIDTIDVIAAQRHFTSCSAHPEKCLLGCALTAGDVNSDGIVSTIDVIAIQRFSLGITTGTANVGKYKFAPTIRVYSGLISNQTAQNYDTLILGDVASHFVE